MKSGKGHLNDLLAGMFLWAIRLDPFSQIKHSHPLNIHPLYLFNHVDN